MILSTMRNVRLKPLHFLVELDVSSMDIDLSVTNMNRRGKNREREKVFARRLFGLSSTTLN